MSKNKKIFEDEFMRRSSAGRRSDGIFTLNLEKPPKTHKRKLISKGDIVD